MKRYLKKDFSVYGPVIAYLRYAPEEWTLDRGYTQIALRHKSGFKLRVIETKPHILYGVRHIPYIPDGTVDSCGDIYFRWPYSWEVMRAIRKWQRWHRKSDQREMDEKITKLIEGKINKASNNEEDEAGAALPDTREYLKIVSE